MTCVYIFSIIISKFYYKKKLYLVILLKIDNNLKVGFYYIILLFNLAVYLEVKSYKKFLFSIKNIIK